MRRTSNTERHHRRTAVPSARFLGAVAADVERRDRAGTEEEVERWAERMSTAASLEDVLG